MMENCGRHATQAKLHRWHLRHVLHLDHLARMRAARVRTVSRTAGHLRTAVVGVTAAAVVAAGLTVEATSRAPSGPGTAAQPAVAAYAAPLAASPSVSPSVAPADYPINRQISDVSGQETPRKRFFPASRVNLGSQMIPREHVAPLPGND